MSVIHSKSTQLYRQVRRALQSGRYLPGQRIDPGMLAVEFNTSATPVRSALYRLVGEGLIDDHARNGLHVPLLTEVGLHDLYDWMERLLLMACDIGGRPARDDITGGDDVVKMTWQLFDAIAEATAHRSLHRAVRQANDRLAPVRRAKRGLIEHAHEELVELEELWRRRNMPALKAGLRAYHARRKQLVPRIVAMLVDHRDHLQ
ncbi:MAG: GntR family transcriptional regulator [Stenotrophomonas nitritireducens]|uniref:GntR family transcriptional regulator n=1 Tax=Stenotrophomonas nitritireducens TaxID=83617 RepID=UPI001AC427CE|nr:GntR family transcriptional regulator [Stenotrophomonas nitritireducens]MBN8791435.1 GntR family transcriptional regulator [Stenotrophomonas nitritireducens]MBN8795375.1 GntR family transcriptional regulator [Stenotrophomonas nitritireducens]